MISVARIEIDRNERTMQPAFSASLVRAEQRAAPNGSARLTRGIRRRKGVRRRLRAAEPTCRRVPERGILSRT